jgi:hypothetical protein
VDGDLPPPPGERSWAGSGAIFGEGNEARRVRVGLRFLITSEIGNQTRRRNHISDNDICWVRSKFCNEQRILQTSTRSR